MTSQTIRFEKMNSDIDPKFLPEGNYISAVNCRPNNLNSGAGYVLENIPSTLAITPPSFGQYVTRIGGCNDYKRTSIIAFYRGLTRQFVTSLNVETQTETIILISSVLDFSKQITHAGVLDDDLFFIDGADKLRKVNIPLALSDVTQDRFSSGDLLVDKFPPLFPPAVEAVEDASFSGNNITNSIFQFCYAWKYAGKEISSWSPISKSVLPESADDITFANNKINVSVNTGGKFVEEIYVAYRIGESGEFKVTEIVNKQELGLSDDATYVHEFYNQKFVEALVKTDVLSNTNNPFYEFGTMAISKDNFLIAGWVKDGLTKPTDIVLSLHTGVQGSESRVASYKFGAVHEFGIVFRDENGRTDGVNAVKSIEIPFFTEIANTINPILSAPAYNLPYAMMSWQVSGTAPSWAKTMSIVYLGNKTLSSFVQYTLSKIQDVGIYTYIDISLLNSIKTASSVLDPGQPSSNISSYTFTKGDRIRFITDKDGNLLNGLFDYEILGYVPETVDSAGNILFPNTIYTNKISNWVSLNIDERSTFEIYSPKKEYADHVYTEVAEVFEIVNGVYTSSGNLTDGDCYVFERDMPVYEIGELISDPEKLYDYTGRVGFSPQMNVVKQATDIKASGYSINDVGGCFYHNTSGETKTVEVTGDYEFTSESNNGYWFKIRQRTESSTIEPEYVIFEEGNHTLASDRIVSHKGTISNTFYVANGQYLGVYFDNHDLDSSHLIFRTAPSIKISAKIYSTGDGKNVTSFVESKDYSDYYASDEHSLGRPYTEIKENIDKKNNIVYSGRYFADTDINETNKFNAVDVRYVPYEFGYINLMRVKGDTLKVFTPNKEMSFYLGKEQYADGTGSSQFVLTSNLISQQPRVYDSDYGTENPESCLSVGNDIYYFDRKNSAIVRTSDNGQLSIGDFGYSAELRRLTKLFTAGTAKNVYIGYNDKNYEVIICFVVDGVQNTIVFKESDNTWSHKLELENSSNVPVEGMINYGENMVTYLAGVGYLWEQGATYSTFFGEAKQPSISFVCNQNPINTKVFKNISYQGEGKWNIAVETEKDNIHPYGQYTYMPKGRQKTKEGIQWTDISNNLKDKNNVISSLRYAKGQPMRGRYATITLTNEDTTRVLLDEVTVDYIASAVQ